MREAARGRMRGNTCMVILIGARWKTRIEPADLYTHALIAISDNAKKFRQQGKGMHLTDPSMI